MNSKLKKILSLLMPFLIGLVVILPAVSPFFRPEFFQVHDYTHVARLAELDRAVRDGHIPPRWSQNFGFGYGMPLFSFYAPLPYYTAWLISLFGFTYIAAIKLTFILTFYLSFLFIYYLAREYSDGIRGYMPAVAAIYIPYRAVDVFVRGSLGELFGIMAIAGALLCLHKLITEKKAGWLLLSLIMVAAVFLSHNILSLIGIPLLIIYSLGLLIITKTKDIKVWVKTGLSFILGFGLSGFFVIPAFLEKCYTSVMELTQGGGDYSGHFVFIRQLFNSPFGYGGSIPGLFDGLSFEIGKVHLILLLLTLGLIILFWKKYAARQKGLFGLLLLLFIISVALTTARSQFLYNFLPLLAFVQFPWRFLSLVIILLPLVLAYVLPHDWSTRSKISGTTLVSLLLIVYYQPLFKPESYLADDDEIYYSSPSRIKAEMSTVIPDYINPRLSHLVMSPIKEIEPALERFEIIGTKDGNLEVLENKTHLFSLKASAPEPYVIRINIFDFPGWQVYVDGNPVEYAVGTDLPVMEIAVNDDPLRMRLIEGRLTETPIRKAANSISLGCAAVLISGILIMFIRKVYGLFNNRA